MSHISLAFFNSTNKTACTHVTHVYNKTLPTNYLNGPIKTQSHDSTAVIFQPSSIVASY